MKPSLSDRVDIIRLVEESHLPARRTLEILGIARSSFSGDLAEWLDDRKIEHIRGAPIIPRHRGRSNVGIRRSRTGSF